MKARLVNSIEEIARVNNRPPPLVSVPLMDETVITRPFQMEEVHDYVRPMEHHLIGATLIGDGDTNVRFGKQEIRTKSFGGSINLIPRGLGGAFDCDGKPVVTTILLGHTRLWKCAEEMDSWRSPELVPKMGLDDGKLFSIVELICREADDPGSHQRLYLEHLMELLCIQLLRDHSAFPAHAPATKSGLLPWQVRKVTRYMEDNLGQQIGLEELAGLLGLSRYYFCTAFRAATGCTPHEWLVRLRIKRACELLRQELFTITDVALAVGYQTPSSFTQAFRSCVGVTPRDFRRHL